MEFDDEDIYVKLQYWIRNVGYVVSEIRISCREPDWQLSAIAQVCNSCLPPLSTVEDFHIEPGRFLYRFWRNDAIKNALGLELLLPFTVVKNLYISKEFALDIAAALQQLVGGRITEVLPSLRNIFVKGIEPQEPFREHIGESVAARQLSGHPVAISVCLERRMRMGVCSICCGDRGELDGVPCVSLEHRHAGLESPDDPQIPAAQVELGPLGQVIRPTADQRSHRNSSSSSRKRR